ncbi:MAG: hypothetical protein WCD38_11620 [Candidatus Tumulicola sp.]
MSNSIWTPGARPSAGTLAAADAVEEAVKIAAWMRNWPKATEKTLALGDLRDLVIARSRIYLWDRAKTEAILALAAKDLGLDGPPKPVAKDRGALKAVPQCTHKWRDPFAAFLTCERCGLIAQATNDQTAGGEEATRVGRSTPEEAAVLRGVSATPGKKRK